MTLLCIPNVRSLGLGRGDVIGSHSKYALGIVSLVWMAAY